MARLFRRETCIRSYAFTVLMALASLGFLPGCEEKQRLKSGDAAPVFSASDASGVRSTLDQFKGNIVVLYFWTNSCCGERLKEIEPVYGRNRQKGLAILAVNVGDPAEAVASYARDNGLTFTMLTDERAKIFNQYGAIGFPTVYIIDKHGIVRKKIVGDMQAGQLERLVLDQFTMQKETEAAYEKIHRR